VSEPVVVHRVTGADAGVAEPHPEPTAEGRAASSAAPVPSARGESHAERRGRFAIVGVLRESESGRVLSDHLVRAFDKDLIFDDYLGEGLSDAAGRFEILFTDEQFANLFEQQPDVYLRIYDPSGTRELDSTEESVRWNAGAVESFEIEIPAERLRAGGA
jgi:hypothetical protein